MTDRAAVVEWLTPLARLYDSVSVVWNYNAADYSFSTASLHGIPVLVIYAAAGIVFAVLAYAAYRRRRRPLAGAILAALVPFAAMAAEQRGITVPLWSGDRQVQGIVLLACLLLDVVLCAQVPLYGIRRLLKKRCVS